MQWKMTLQLAIAMEEALTALQMEQINYPRRCAIGRWLDSSVTLPVRDRGEYTDLVRKHAHFHKQMGVVAELIQAASFDKAMTATKANSPFVAASEALADAILACDRVLPIAAPL